MADGRFLSKTIAHDLDLSSVSMTADWLFMRCIPHLDREGRMEGHAAVVRGIVCPLRQDVDANVVDAALAELHGKGLIQRYVVGGKEVLNFPGFGKNQKGFRKDREAPSRFEGPENGSEIPLRTTPEDSGPTPDNSGGLRTNSGDGEHADSRQATEVVVTEALTAQAEKSLRTTPEDSGLTPEYSRLSEVKLREVKGSEVKARATHEVSQLRDWLGDHAGALDGFPDNPPVESSLFGQYGPTGTESHIWSGTKPADRSRLLATALLRCSTENRSFQGKFFRKVLLDVIAESKAGQAAPKVRSNDELMAEANARREKLEEERKRVEASWGEEGPPKLSESWRTIGKTVPDRPERPAA